MLARLSVLALSLFSATLADDAAPTGGPTQTPQPKENQSSSQESLRGSTKSPYSSDNQSSSQEPLGLSTCLCVFDIDRTLTGKQGVLASRCPGNRPVVGVEDPAYGGGVLTLSELGSEGLGGTFCSACYLGVVSAGNAGGHGSRERGYLMQHVLTSAPQRALSARIRAAHEWSHAGHVRSPFILGQPDGTKQEAVGSIVAWYSRQGVDILPSSVHFFGDRRENIPPFATTRFNARQISCASRDMSLGRGMVGLCGAALGEIVATAGVSTCGQRATEPQPQPQPQLDSSPGQHGHDLQACQGDCDDDRDCLAGAGLRCFQRFGFEPVPGCGGVGIWGFDYCYRAGPAPSPPSTSSAPTPPSFVQPEPGPEPEPEPELDSSPGHNGWGSPLQRCQGDCDGDSDCVGALRCFQRQGTEPVPGCRGPGRAGWDYCHAPQGGSQPGPGEGRGEPPQGGVQPPASQPLDSSPGHNGWGAPLGNCQGDCDQDRDCAGELRCLQRSGLEPVPGCSGTGVSGFDYCYMPTPGVPASPVPELDSSPGHNGRGSPQLQKCQGDCDSDRDCAAGLRCFQRIGYSGVPGCAGRGVWDFDYCVEAAALR